MTEEVEREAVAPEVFRGTFEECFNHLAQCIRANAPKGLAGSRKARQPIVDFCGVNTQTANDWLEKRSQPLGEIRVKMMCCLDALGYRVAELERLTNSRRTLAEMVGYGLFNLVQMAEILGYKNSQDVSTILNRGAGMSDEKHERLSALCKQHKESLQSAKEQAKQRCRLGFSLMDSIRQRKTSAVLLIMQGLLNLLNSKEVGEVFVQSLKELQPLEKENILRLADVFHELSQQLTKQVIHE